MTQRIRRSSLKHFGIFLLIVGFTSLLPISTVAQDTLTLNINRNVGMAFGSFIQGTFTLSGSGPEDVQNLTVYFNGDEVYFVLGNTISWQFNTGNYPSGSMNITLFGVDDVGATYVAHRQLTFIGGAVGGAITIGIIVLVVILILVKYGSRITSMRRN